MRKNPFLFFLPLLFLYVVYIFIMYQVANVGDEFRYLFFTNNLLNGTYSPPPPNVDLINGPGYPLILAPLMAMGLSKIWLVMLNAVFHYLSVVFLFKTLLQFISFKKALLFSLFWGLYYVAYQNMAIIASEPIILFLVPLFMFLIAKAFAIKEENKLTKKYILLAGFIGGYIVLTKVVFGYVVWAMLAGCFILWLSKRSNVNYRKAVFILLVAFATFSPYLIYTYKLTGRPMYFGNGYNNLYWMSTPFEGEFGEWRGYTLPRLNGRVEEFKIPGADSALIANHKSSFDEIFRENESLKVDDAFKKVAIENIKAHPLKYAQNIVLNTGRLVFSYPFSYLRQKPKNLFVIIINAVLFTFLLLSLIPTFINWRIIGFPLQFLLMFALLYLGATVLVCAETRMFTVIVPILLVWFAQVFQKSIKIKWQWQSE